MIIDFHTHIFPDRIAEQTIEKLSRVGGVKGYTDGTLTGLKNSMQENNISMSVVLPVVTKPSQFDTVNAYAAEINGIEGILSFGGIHPEMEGYREGLERIKQLGLKGIKLHPDYQDTYIDDVKMVRIIQYAAELGLIVVIHAGIDIGLPKPVHCPPDRAANMLKQIEALDAKIVLAHMGGYGQWDQVEEELVGKRVWMDTSYSLGMIEKEQFVRIIKNHGADRILFATDSPWSGQKEAKEYLSKLDLAKEEMEHICYRNALNLLEFA